MKITKSLSYSLVGSWYIGNIFGQLCPSYRIDVILKNDILLRARNSPVTLANRIHNHFLKNSQFYYICHNLSKQFKD